MTNVFDEPYGAPGVETLLPVVFDQWVSQRGGDVGLLAEALSTNPARIFGLYPRKGVIQPGSDADLVIVDPGLRRTITAAGQHTTARYTLYEGREVTGWPVLSTVRGQVVLDDGQLEQPPGYGRYQPREPADLMATGASR
jgi:dihydropyrimidinase